MSITAVLGVMAQTFLNLSNAKRGNEITTSGRQTVYETG